MSARYITGLDFTLDTLKLLRAEDLSQGQIAEHFGMHRSTVSRVMRKLEDAGYVERKLLRVQNRRDAMVYRLCAAWRGA